MSKTSQEKLQEIREKKKQLDNQAKSIIARDKEQARKDDTRRKIIIGGIVLHYIPDWHTLDPKDEANFAAVDRMMRNLTADPELMKYLASQP